MSFSNNGGVSFHQFLFFSFFFFIFSPSRGLHTIVVKHWRHRLSIPEGTTAKSDKEAVFMGQRRNRVSFLHQTLGLSAPSVRVIDKLCACSNYDVGNSGVSDHIWRNLFWFWSGWSFIEPGLSLSLSCSVDALRQPDRSMPTSTHRESVWDSIKPIHKIPSRVSFLVWT